MWPPSSLYLPVVFPRGEASVGQDTVAVTEALWVIRKPPQQSAAAHPHVPVKQLQHRVSSLRIQLHPLWCWRKSKGRISKSRTLGGALGFSNGQTESWGEGPEGTLGA